MRHHDVLIQHPLALPIFPLSCIEKNTVPLGRQLIFNSPGVFMPFISVKRYPRPLFWTEPDLNLSKNIIRKELFKIWMINLLVGGEGFSSCFSDVILAVGDCSWIVWPFKSQTQYIKFTRVYLFGDSRDVLTEILYFKKPNLCSNMTVLWSLTF